MPLDQNLAAVLAKLEEAAILPDANATPDEILKQARADYLKLSFESRTSEEIVPVRLVKDITLPGPDGPLTARVFYPEDTGPVPTIVYFHGGGWVIGDLNTHDNMCRDVCRGAGAVVVSVEYRLAPESPFPAAVDDAVAATRWVIENAKDFGGTDRIGVAGDSAGGNLSAVVAQSLRDSGENLAGQFLIYPATDHPEAHYASKDENGAGYFLESAQMEWFFANYLGQWPERQDPRLAPIQAENLADLPPAMIVTAEFDPLRDEGEAYGKALKAAGVRAETRRIDGMIHGFFDMGRWSPKAQTAITECGERFGQMLRA